MVFLYRSPTRRQANKSEFIPPLPAKYVRRVPSRVCPPRAISNRSFEELLLSLSLSLCIHRPGRSCGSKGVGDSSRIPAFSSLKRQRLRWVSTWTDNAPLLRDRSMLMTRPLLLSRLSFPRVSNITSACICIFPFSKEFFFSSFLEGSTNVRWTRHCFEGRGRKLRFVFRELN